MAAAAAQPEPGEVPKGNWVARNLRLMNHDSKDLFPKTPAQHKPGKFHSIYKKDFYEYPTEVVMEGLAPKGKGPDRETIRDVLFGQSPTAVHVPRRQPKHPVPPVKACLLPPNPADDQGFASWRIPNRLSGEVEEARIGDHVGLAVPDRVETPKILRQSTLPAIALRENTKVFTPKPRLSAADAVQRTEGPRRPLVMTRAKTTLDTPSKSPLTLNPGPKTFQARAAQWQIKLPDVDPRLLHKVLRLQDSQNAAATAAGPQQKLRGTLLPDARRTVERWLESASEPERKVALQFFRSLAGGKLMGAPQGTGHNERLKDVVDALQKYIATKTSHGPGSRWVAEAGLSPRGGIFGACIKPQGPMEEETEESGTSGPKHLKNFRLLDPSTRQNRWMHTTWHHLPQYQHAPDAATNSSSHYVRPHQLPHRHFVIHPDWPPNKH